MLPLTGITMLVFHSGDDCVERAETKLKTDEEKLKNVTGLFANGKSGNGGAEVGTGNKHLAIKFSDIYNNQVTDLFYPYDDVEEFLNTAITSLSSGFVTRFFLKICSWKHKDIEEINKDYREFCKIYRKEGCLEKPHDRKCQMASNMFYEKKRVVGICDLNFINQISLSNRVEKEDRTTWIDKVLPYIFTMVLCAMILGVLLFESWHEDYCRDLDNDTITRGDFALMMTGLPHGEEAEGFDVEQAINDMVSSQGFEIQEVSFVFDTEKYESVKQNFWGEVQKQYKENYKMHQSGISVNPIGVTSAERDLEGVALVDKSVDKIYTLRDKVKEFEKRFVKKDPTLMIGKAFIMFNLTEDRDKFYERFKRVGFFYERFKYGHKTNEDLILNFNSEQRKVFVELPREPNDVIWQELKYSMTQKFIRSLFSFIVGSIIIGSGLYMVYYLKTNKTIDSIDQPVKLIGERYSAQHFNTLIMTLIISLMGVVLKVVLKLLSKFEKHGSHTNEHLSFTQKLWKVKYLLT